jgi:hypothetical protein
LWCFLADSVSETLFDCLSLNFQYRKRVDDLEARCQAAECQNGILETNVGALKNAMDQINGQTGRLAEQNAEMANTIRLCQKANTLNAPYRGRVEALEGRCQAADAQNGKRFGNVEKQIGELRTGIAQVKSEAGRLGHQAADMANALRLCQEANTLNVQCRARVEALELRCQATDTQNGKRLGVFEKEADELRKAISTMKSATDQLSVQNAEMTKAIRLCQEPPGLFMDAIQIVSTLFLRSGGHIEKFVKVDASSFWSADHEPAKILDPSTSSYFCSAKDGASGQWIRWAFQGLIVRPFAYAIRSAPCDRGWHHPKTWVLESSNSGIDGPWKEIHKVENDSSLQGRSLFARYSITTEADCRFIRFRQPGVSHSNSHYLGFAAVEFFGSLREG